MRLTKWRKAVLFGYGVTVFFLCILMTPFRHYDYATRDRRVILPSHFRKTTFYTTFSPIGWSKVRKSESDGTRGWRIVAELDFGLLFVELLGVTALAGGLLVLGGKKKEQASTETS